MSSGDKDSVHSLGNSKNRRLIDQMTDGYANNQIICNDQGQPIDYRILETNKAFATILGVESEDVVGRTILEILPNLDSVLIEKFGRVALTGEPTYFEQYGEQVKRHLAVTAFCSEPNHFACFIRDITERKESNRLLCESEARYRSLVEQQTDFVCRYNPDGTFTFVNSVFCEFFGKSKDELIGHKWLPIPIDEDLGLVQEKLQTMSADNQVVIIENRVVAATGEIHWIQFVNRGFFDDNDELVETTSVGRDITARKLAEEKLKITEKRTRTYLESSPACTKILDLDFNLHYMSNAGVVGLKIDKVENHYGKVYPFYFFPKPSADRLTELLKEARRTGKTIVEEAALSDIDGNELWFDTNIVPVHDDNGKLEYIMVVSVNITQRKNAELALAAEKERLIVTLRSIGDGVITTDIDGNIVMLNKSAETLTGWNSEEAIGRPLPEVFDIIGEGTGEKRASPVDRVLATGGIIELEDNTLLVSKDGRKIAIADSGAPIHDKNSKIIGVVLVFRDMTEKQKLEESLQRAQKLESLGVLAGGIAHDFNNLLGGIFGYTEMALAATTDEEVSSCLTSSISNLDRARSLTQQLLTFAKGGVPIKKVEHLFPFVQKSTKFALSGSSVSSMFDVEDNLWPCDFDRNQLGQVIDNLTINAQQAMPNGGSITVAARNTNLKDKEHITLAAGNYVKLSIKDQGIGIPKEFLPSIFDPYYTTKPKGHGLGLATCYSIISQHDGCIDVVSEPGKGSTFSVYLPAVVEPVVSMATQSPGKFKSSGTFLVMDDEEPIRMVMKKMLVSFGYTVVIKEDGKEAVDYFLTEHNAGRKLAGIIFDLTVPGGMGGKEAIGEIRKVCADTPVFVASGYSVDPIMANPTEYGFNASISKPFMRSELAELFAELLK